MSHSLLRMPSAAGVNPAVLLRSKAAACRHLDYVGNVAGV